MQGERLMETLKQPQYSPIPVEHQVIILYVASNRYLMDIDVKQVRRFNTELVKFIDEKYPQVAKSITETGELKADIEEVLKKAIDEFKKEFKR